MKYYIMGLRTSLDDSDECIDYMNQTEITEQQYKVIEFIVMQGVNGNE